MVTLLQVHDAYMDKLKYFSVPVKDKDIKYCMSWWVYFALYEIEGFNDI